MHSGNPVDSLASAIYTTIASPEIIPDIERTWRNDTNKVRPGVTDLQIIHFPQMWGSTALGFGGMGGAAMTTAYTTVIICEENAAVFFGGRHCYSIDNINEDFMNDVNKRHMASLADAHKKY